MRFRDRVWTAAAPPGPVVTVDQLRAHTRIDSDSEDSLLESYLAAAVEMVEGETQRLLTRRAITLRLPALPDAFTPLELPGGVVASITSVTADGEVIEPEAYDVVGDSPAMLYPLAAWPIVTGEGLPVTIIYQAGYAAEGTPPSLDYGANVPADLRVAVMMIAAEMERQRTEGSDRPVARVPVGAARAIARHRIRPL